MNVLRLSVLLYPGLLRNKCNCATPSEEHTAGWLCLSQNLAKIPYFKINSNLRRCILDPISPHFLDIFMANNVLWWPVLSSKLNWIYRHKIINCRQSEMLFSLSHTSAIQGGFSVSRGPKSDAQQNKEERGITMLQLQLGKFSHFLLIFFLKFSSKGISCFSQLTDMAHVALHLKRWATI